MQTKRLSIFALILLCAAGLGSAQSQNVGAVGRGVSISFQNASGSADQGVSIGFSSSLLTLTSTPTALSFSYQQGAAGTIPGKTISVTSGSIPIAISAFVSTTQPGGTWLSISSAATITPGNISVAVSPTLTAGLYSGSLQVTSASAANSPITIPILVSVSAPAVTTGSVKVQSTPPGAFFQVSGPGLTYFSGNTPYQHSGLPVGTYKITWGILLGGYRTPPSESQTLEKPGDALTFSATYVQPSSSGFTLEFPLAGKDPYSAGLNTAFDHSMSDRKPDPTGKAIPKYTLYNSNGMDGVIVDFANERGETASPHCDLANISTCCYPSSPGLLFFANTAYTPPYGTLAYENHPGIDYQIDGATVEDKRTTQVLAAVSGEVVYPSRDSVTGISMIGLVDPSEFHVLAIKPKEPKPGDYIVYYLHLDTYKGLKSEPIANPPSGCPDQLPILPLQTIKANCVIGRAGGWGPPSKRSPSGRETYDVHLHFEVHKVVSKDQIPTSTVYKTVRFLCPPEVDPTGMLACIPVDPYGWDGPAKDLANKDKPGDPYTQLTGIENVRLWNHLPITVAISPDNVRAGAPTQITLAGDGFISKSKVMAVDAKDKTRKAILLTSTISSTRQISATITASSGATQYYVYVVTPVGKRSNWQRLAVSPATGGNRQ